MLRTLGDEWGVIKCHYAFPEVKIGEQTVKSLF